MTNRKRISLAATWGLISVTFLACSIQSLAQSQEQPAVDSKTKTDDQLIKCFLSYMAEVEIEVRNRHGKDVSDLRKDDFVVYEDGVRQELVFWKRNEGVERKPQQFMYEAGYYPRNPRFTGEFRKIRVVVRAKGTRRLRVEFSPKGYYSKKELLK